MVYTRLKPRSVEFLHSGIGSASSGSTKVMSAHFSAGELAWFFLSQSRKKTVLPEKTPFSQFFSFSFPFFELFFISPPPLSRETANATTRRSKTHVVEIAAMESDLDDLDGGIITNTDASVCRQRHERQTELATVLVLGGTRHLKHGVHDVGHVGRVAAETHVDVPE